MNSTFYQPKAILPTGYMLLFLLLLGSLALQAQDKQGQPGKMNPERMKEMRAKMSIGHFYGKVVDEDGKGIGYAAIQLFGKRFNRETKQMEESLISGQITEDNGDFSMKELPIVGNFTLKISILGYSDYEQEVTFGVERPKGGPGGRPSGGGGYPGGGGFNPAAMAGKYDVDLGNIVMKTDAETLEEIVVKGEATNVKLALDRKIFRVDKDASATGGTAEDALRNVPSLNVDIDGNLTLRNASPQLFVDGRPTTLSLDQISAEEIETVEVITNPSAKFDASGGQAGIVNIVLKKERRLGYNGNARAGFDSYGGGNASANINLREGKVNFFLGGNLFVRQRNGTSETLRENFFSDTITNVLQAGENAGGGYFASGRMGLDWFVDNRNSFTFEGNIRRGQFTSDDELMTTTDTLLSDRSPRSESTRFTDGERAFTSYSGAVLYKHLFPKKGKEITADVSFNTFTMDNFTNFRTDFDTGIQTEERQNGGGSSDFITLQTDYVEPIGENGKIELGARGAFRFYNNSNANLVFDPEENVFVRIPTFADEYEFEDNVLAAYVTYSQDFEDWGYQVGLRAESSSYTGTLPETQQTFENDYPISLFPSVFVTRKLNDKDNLQFSYSRRINRPSFFNLIPFTDFSDSLNLRRGNPNLLPEFTNSYELTYQNIFEKGDNILISAYYKQASDLITTYQFIEFDPALLEDLVITSFANSDNSYAYGLEFTSRNSFAKIFTLTSNLNLYNSRVDASNIDPDLVNSQFTWFLKENLQINIPKVFTLQIDGQYQSRTAFSPSNDSGRFRGWRRRATNTAQGYTIPVWFVNVSVRKSIMKRKATITASLNDVFRSRRTGSFSETLTFIQDAWRLRNPQMLRVNFSYRFGKPDTSLFKRKNMKRNSAGSELMN